MSVVTCVLAACMACIFPDAPGRDASGYETSRIEGLSKICDPGLLDSMSECRERWGVRGYIQVHKILRTAVVI